MKKTKSLKLTQEDFLVETLGENCYPSVLDLKIDTLFDPNIRVIYNNTINIKDKVSKKSLLTFERSGPCRMIHFDSPKINVGIVTCGGLCPGLNDVIRSITYSCLDGYKVKCVYGFKYGFQGLTANYCHEAMILNQETVDNIHEQGGTILASSRGNQPIEDMVDTLVKFNISILFVIGGDGTQHGSMAIAEEIKKRKLDISIMGIPKTIDNDVAFVHKTFGFDTACEHARNAIDSAHVEAKGAKNGIGLVKLMGRHSGHIAAHATLSSGNVNMCLIPEEPIALEEILEKIKKRFEKKEHMVIVVAEGFGQDILQKHTKAEYDASGNLKLKDIGVFLKNKITEYLSEEKVEHSIKYIDPSYMIRSTRANAVDSSFCLRLGNYAVHAAMNGKTNALIGYWSDHYTIVPLKLALQFRKNVDIKSGVWRSVREITV